MTDTSAKRVVITGMGTISPTGNSVSQAWTNLVEGRTGVAPIQSFDTEGCPVTFAAEVKDFDITAEVGPYHPRPDGPPLTQIANAKDARKMGKFIHYCLGAGLEAYADSGLDQQRDQVDPTRIGVNIGVGMGGLDEICQVHSALTNKGYRRITPYFIPQVIPNLASGQLSILLNFRGPNMCNVSACSSSAHSVGESFRAIQRGEADIIFAGGAEAVVSPMGIGGFAAMRALSSRNDAPEKASRPFDKDRDGFVMGEGSAVLVMETLESAQKRNAKIYAEIVGYGASGDAYHLTLPAPEGEGGARAMKAAVESAGIAPEAVHYVNAHGTSTPSGDAEEIRAISEVFPNAKEHLQISSTKSMTGHLLGAAGALEAMACIKALETGVIPPTVNLDNLEPELEGFGFNFTANQAQSREIEYALSNSFGFGGTNASLIFKKYK